MKRMIVIPLLLCVLLLSACGATAVDDVTEPEPTAPAAAATNTPDDAYPPPAPLPAYPGESAPYPAEREELKDEPEAYPGQDLRDATPVPIEEDDMSQDPYPGEEPAPDVPAAVYNMPLVQDMIQDLSQREQIDAEDIRIMSFEEVTWRDSSLGCPRPGMQYLQVLTEGFKVVLEADGEQYDYHASNSRFVLCR